MSLLELMLRTNSESYVSVINFYTDDIILTCEKLSECAEYLFNYINCKVIKIEPDVLSGGTPYLKITIGD